MARSYLTDCRSLIDILCEYNHCTPHSLPQILKRKKRQNLKFLSDYILITNHLRHNRIISPDNITFVGADCLFAYRGFMGITVAQHLYSRHRIILKYPTFPCIVMYGSNGHRSYFPLELLQI